MGCRIHAIVLLLLVGCASPYPFPMPAMPAIEARVAALLPADAILLGEQHDAPTHQGMHRRVIEVLGARGALAGVAIEMAEQGRSTAGLPREAAEADVRIALQWSDTGWPWQAYAPAVMAAVRAGVPVIGANLPRSQMRNAMVDAALDASVPNDVLQAQRSAVREGHCGLLPDTQIGPMTRVQIARDRAMAQAIAQAAVPGKTVVLLAGAGHVDATLGVPRHLPPALRVRAELLPAEPPKKDYCAELREQLKGKPTP
ncbi:ChaN family lipoprotein [Ramlibacter sp. WS9]|uniref:ChaN family lipoprotein n=1 Tax=Ramlibacter sp. WS9 TaxID=1882741 RepID=UPI0011431C8E|nr:ChaN family lipoprotein [Ramlibacter sp. WS9]ROZ79060.1 hypothetical protein EEB15_05115 [Ramlibacter sp. WS9]